MIAETAAALGVQWIRIWAGILPSAACSPEIRRRTVEYIRQLCRHAGGMQVAAEKHRGTLTDEAASAARLLDEVGVLSLLQATLTLPGIAAMALTLGMAIDSNVLINERIREEVRNGATPQAAISAGYSHAFDTILDSNITTLIAGIALLAFGSGPVRGFAVVHCLGILTSIFTSVVVSRMIVNFIYGQRKVARLHIG